MLRRTSDSMAERVEAASAGVDGVAIARGVPNVFAGVDFVGITRGVPNSPAGYFQ